MNRSLSTWHVLTATLLFLGYAGYYFCRTNLALAKSSLGEEFAAVGITTDSITRVASIALICYAIGKLVNGTLCDFVGGRVMFIGGMIGSVACTLLFVASPSIAGVIGYSWLLPLFILSFSLNRFIQSSGWGALVKITVAWFSFRAYGRVMGVLCMSYLFGDFLARQVLALWMGDGGGWRSMFVVSAIILGVIAVLNVLLLRSRPSDVGLDAPEVSPANLYGLAGEEERPTNLKDLLVPYLSSFSFWLVLLMSITLTFVRESSNFFNNDYLKVAAQVDDQTAAIYSSYFPLFGALAVFLAGVTTDRLYQGRRGLLMAGLLALLMPVLWAMAFVPGVQGTQWPVVLVCAVGFLSLAPYAFLTGAIAMDLGGKRGSSTAAGILDSVGYAVGGVLGLEIKTYLVQGDTIADWRSFFGLMLVLVGLTTVACVAYWIVQERTPAVSRTSLT